METESNILRSPALIRQTISELRDQGQYNPPPGMLSKLAEPFKRYVSTPLREYVINPLRDALGMETDPVRDTGGFHVLRVVTRKALSPPTFEAARLDVEAEFAAEQARRALADNAAQLRRLAAIDQVEFEP